MYQENSILSEIANGPLSLATRAYLGQRAKNAFYDYVMDKFYASGLTKADLARRLGKDQGQVNRLLGSPGNWTVETAAELLAAIAGEELIPHSIPFDGRAKQNRTQTDILNELPARRSNDPVQSPSGSSASVVTRRLETVQ